MTLRGVFLTTFTFLTLTLLLVGCPTVEQVDPQPVAPPPPSGPMLLVPRTCMTVPEALTVAHLQVGLQYAAPDDSLRGVVGPYPLGKEIPLSQLISDVSEAAGLSVDRRDGVVVFSRPVDGSVVQGLVAALAGQDAAASRRAAYDLGQLAAPQAIPALMAAVGSADESTAYGALMALDALEKDFTTRARYSGRVSLITLFGDDSGQDALLYIIDEHADQGGPTWLAAVSVASRARRPGVTPLLMKTLANRGGFTRGDDRPVRAAAWACSQYKDPATVTPLADLLGASDVDYTLARETAVALGRINLGASVQELGKAAKSSRVPVRRAAAEGLGWCSGREETLSILREMLKDDDPTTACLAAEAMGRLNMAGALSLLGAALNTDLPTPVRVACALAIGRTWQGGAREALLAAKNTDDARVRAAVAEAIGVIGGPGAEGALLGLISDTDLQVRAAAARALGRLGTLNTVLAAGTVLSNRNEPTMVLLAAADGLGESHQAPEAVRELEKVAANPQAFGRLRDLAVIALGRNATREAQGALFRLIPQAAATAADRHDLALRVYDPDDKAAAARLFAGYLRSGDRSQKAYSADRLSELADAYGLEQMILRSDEWDDYVRMAIVWGTIRSRGPNVVPTLISQMASRRASVRRTVALALGAHKDPRAVDALLTLSTDRDATVRFAAAQSLGLTGDPAAVPRLIAMALEETEKQPADAAIRALRWRYFAWRDDVRKALNEVTNQGRDKSVPAVNAILHTEDDTWRLVARASDPADPTMRAAGYGGSVVSSDASVLQPRGRRVGTPIINALFRSGPSGWQWSAADTDGTVPADKVGEWQFSRRLNLAASTPAAEGAGDSRGLVVQDTKNKVELMFSPPQVDNGLLVGTVQVYVRTKGGDWKFQDVKGPAPACLDFAVGFDADRGVAVLLGGTMSRETGTSTVLEAWTYAHKAGGGGGARMATTADEHRPTVSVLGNGRVQLEWPAVAGARGYNIMRAPVTVDSLWTGDPAKGIGAFETVNAKPVTDSRYEDTVDALRGVRADSDTAAPIFAYKVVPQGVRTSGADAPAVLTLADAPTGVLAVERDDGTVLVTWTPSPQEALRGYLVYRQDVFASDMAVRQNPSPSVLPMFVDERPWPRADRRKYYVVPVDYLGQLGVPSAGAWSHGMP